MGISGLLPMLKSIQRPCNLKKFNGLTLGVDAYGWLHRGAVPCAVDIALGRPTTKYIEFAMHRVRMLIHYGITPYVVFDGDYLPSKAGVEMERAERRSKSRTMGLASYHKGNTTQAHLELQKAVDITPEMAGQLIRELQTHNVKYVVAPYEADAQLAYMERKGIIQGIISEDSDLLVFGCQRLLTKLDQYGECIEISRDLFTACRSISLVDWTDTEFRRMAILSGCDYLDNVSGLGLKTAYRLVRKFKTIEKIIQRLQFDSKYSVPANYLEEFWKAEMTFLHQWVFCPIEKKLVMNTELETSDKTHLSFLGPEIEPDIACGVAYGRLHPTSKQPLKIPPLSNSPRRPSLQSRRQLQPSTPLDTKIGKPINTFFKSRRVPLAELDPNTFTPSPSQQRLQETANRTWLSSPVNVSPQVPTPSSNAPVTVNPDRTRRGSRSLHSANNTSKRQRLCGEDDAGGKSLASKLKVESKFFSGDSVKESPSTHPIAESKGTTSKSKDLCNIWSDDSIDGVFSELTDTSQIEHQRISIFEDSKQNFGVRTNSSFKTASSPSTISRESSTQTAMTSHSFTSSDSTKSSLFARYSLGSAEASVDTKRKWKAAHTSSVMSKHDKDLEPPANSMDYHDRVHNGHVSGQETMTRTERYSDEDGGQIYDSPKGTPTKTENTVPESPLVSTRVLHNKHKPFMTSGSEDSLVPQSDDEVEQDKSPSFRKLDLEHFRFSG